MSSPNTSSLASSTHTASDAEKKSQTKAGSKAHPVTAEKSNDGSDEMPGLVVMNEAKPTSAPQATGKPNVSAASAPAITDTAMDDGDTDVECSDMFDSLDGDSCFDDDISLPDDFIACSGCANRRLRETETRLDLTELELTEAQAKLVKVEIQRDAAIALQATLKTELQLAEQAKLTEVLTPAPVPLADKQRRELESRLHESEERFFALLGDVHRALRSTKAPRGEKSAAEVINLVRDILESTVKRATVDH